MRLQIYLDENMDDNLLIALLERAGHTVISPRKVGSRGWTDAQQLEYVAQHGYVLLTRNADDFEALH